MTLRSFLDEFGITTYDGLGNRCSRMGVTTPSVEEFFVAFPDKPVNNPQEGVVVLEPPPIVSESTGEKIDVDTQPDVSESSPVDQLISNPIIVPTEQPQKKQRKKKDVTVGE
jgi:hypothetical protein